MTWAKDQGRYDAAARRKADDPRAGVRRGVRRRRGLVAVPGAGAAPVRARRPELDDECLPSLWRREALHRRLLGWPTSRRRRSRCLSSSNCWATTTRRARRARRHAAVGRALQDRRPLRPRRAAAGPLDARRGAAAAPADGPVRALRHDSRAGLRRRHARRRSDRGALARVLRGDPGRAHAGAVAGRPARADRALPRDRRARACRTRPRAAGLEPCARRRRRVAAAARRRHRRARTVPRASATSSPSCACTGSSWR